jgi:hypothetical protein
MVADTIPVLVRSAERKRSRPGSRGLLAMQTELSRRQADQFLGKGRLAEKNH